MLPFGCCCCCSFCLLITHGIPWTSLPRGLCLLPSLHVSLKPLLHYTSFSICVSLYLSLFSFLVPSVSQFSCWVLSDSLQPHGLQHARLPSLSPSFRACSNSCPLSQWCHPTISSSVGPFSSHLQSFSASGSFPMNQFFTSGQSIGVSASVSVVPMNIQDWFPLEWIDWISLQSKGLSRVFWTRQFKSIDSSALSFLYCPTLISIHDY